jgi:hypothetical protein
MSITYTPATNFGAKDSLPTNDPDKVIKGSEFTTEFTAIQTAFGLAAPAASPTFTGTVTIASVDINGGTIDGVTIGGSSAGAITGTTGQFNTSLNVDGTVTADGLTVEGTNGNFEVATTGNSVNMTRGGNNFITASNAVGDLFLGAGGVSFLKIDNGGDISFYEDTGTTPKLFWDASAERLGVGTTSPSSTFQVGVPLTATAGIRVSGSWLNIDAGYQSAGVNGTAAAPCLIIGGDGDTGFFHPASDTLAISTLGNERLRIDSSGNVGIGTSSAFTALSFPIGTSKYVGQTAASAHQASNVGSIGFGVSDGGGQSGVFVHNTHNGTFSSQDIRFLTAAGGISTATERMRIDSSGRLLVGTATPVGTEQVLIASSSAGSQPQQLNLKDTNASANGNYFLVARKSDDTYVGGLRRSGTDTALAVDGTAHLAFQISGTEVGRFDGSGNLLVGTTTQSGQITVDNGGNNTGVYVHQSSSSVNHTGISVKSSYVTGGQTGTMVRFIQTSDATVGTISSTTTATAYNTSSDARLKENIADAEDAASLIDAIQVRSFDWKADGSHQRYGMVAQELLEVAPEAVSGDPESDDMMGVDYSKLVPMLVKEIQSLRARVAQLEGA